MENLKILKEETFFELLESKTELPSDVKSSVIFYVQHKKSSNPYLYSAILNAIDSTPNKKFIRPAEIIETAIKTSEKFKTIQIDRYERFDENTNNDSTLSYEDAINKEKVSKAASFSKELFENYKKLDSKEKEIVDNATDEYLFTDEGLQKIKILRRLLNDKNVPEEEILSFLEAQKKDSSLFQILNTIYVKSGFSKNDFEERFNFLEQTLVAHKLTFDTLSAKTLSQLLMQNRAALNLEESDIIEFTMSQSASTSYLKCESTLEDTQKFIDSIKDVSTISNTVQKYRESLLSKHNTEPTISPFTPISDSEFPFEKSAVDLIISPISNDLFLSFNLGTEQNINLINDMHEDLRKEPENTAMEEILPEEKNFSLRDRLKGFINRFIKKQGQLTASSTIRSSEEAKYFSSELEDSEEKKSGILETIQVGLKSLGNLFKTNKAEQQEANITKVSADSNLQSKPSNLFTAGITQETIDRVNEVSKSFSSQTDRKEEIATGVSLEDDDGKDEI